jgi:glyoxylase-like metal-dependent hydrolase (beta-lactamase superfamily II)
MQPELLAEGVYLVPLQVSNCYIWESHGLVTVVDTGVPGSADEIVAALGAIGHAAEAVDEIVLTHFHRDHTSSAADLVRVRVPASASMLDKGERCSCSAPIGGFLPSPIRRLRLLVL